MNKCALDEGGGGMGVSFQEDLELACQQPLFPRGLSPTTRAEPAPWWPITQVAQMEKTLGGTLIWSTCFLP